MQSWRELEKDKEQVMPEATDAETPPWPRILKQTGSRGDPKEAFCHMLSAGAGSGSAESLTQVVVLWGNMGCITGLLLYRWNRGGHQTGHMAGGTLLSNGSSDPVKVRIVGYEPGSASGVCGERQLFPVVAGYANLYRTGDFSDLR